jgi:hypothetical protein
MTIKNMLQSFLEIFDSIFVFKVAEEPLPKEQNDEDSSASEYNDKVINDVLLGLRSEYKLASEGVKIFQRDILFKETQLATHIKAVEELRASIANDKYRAIVDRLQRELDYNLWKISFYRDEIRVDTSILRRNEQKAAHAIKRINEIQSSIKS